MRMTSGLHSYHLDILFPHHSLPPVPITGKLHVKVPLCHTFVSSQITPPMTWHNYEEI